MSVPIRLRDGSVHGMFCCVGFNPNPSLNTRDLQMMKVFAELTAFEIDREVEAKRVVADKTGRIRDVMAQQKIAIHYQPIFGIATNRVVGLESLSRFTAEPKRPPNEWFGEAAEVGLAVELEMTAIRMALSVVPLLPEGVYLAVNASPETILSGELAREFETAALSRIMLEVTEHAVVPSYERLMDELRPLRERGMRLAVDDAGAGYSGLQHILQLQPDLIKLDMALTRNVDLDPARRALAAALISFARDTNCMIVAEGVETASELQALRAIGASAAQGYFLGRPQPFESVAGLMAQPVETRLRA
jgi:EAL domain-containing protein (putative c-di-GMP-specific phosphodiesterase class I)